MIKLTSPTDLEKIIFNIKFNVGQKVATKFEPYYSDENLIITSVIIYPNYAEPVYDFTNENFNRRFPQCDLKSI